MKQVYIFVGRTQNKNPYFVQPKREKLIIGLEVLFDEKVSWNWDEQKEKEKQNLFLLMKKTKKIKKP